MMRAILYLRVSTTDQANHGVSLDSQQAKLGAYAALYDLVVVATITDAGESAKTLNRPGLQQALGMLRRGEADGLVVLKLDRLTRSVADWQELIDGYFGDRAGKQLFSVQDSIDTRTAAGRMVLNILLACSQWEREAIGERTAAALQHKITKGERAGGIRYGYDLDDSGSKLIPNEAEQAVIRGIIEDRALGASLREIADDLNRRQIPTKNGRGGWKHTAVKRILERKA